MRRVLPTVIALAVIGFLAWLFRFAQRWDPVAAPEARGADNLAMMATDAVMISREHGVVQWRMRVDRIDLRRPSGADITDFAAVDFLGIREGEVFDGGRRVATFQAREAAYERPTKRLDVRRAIRLSSVEGNRFASERCLWTEQDEFARFPEGATATIQGDSVRAPTMIYSTRSGVLQCPDGAEAVIRGKPVTARTLDWDTVRRVVRCTGPVTGDRDGIRFSAAYAELNLKLRTIRVNKGALDLRIDSDMSGAGR